MSADGRRRRRCVRVCAALVLGVAAAGVFSACAPDTGPQIVLKVHRAAAGDVIVDAGGYSVYVYDGDTRGTTGTACDAACLREWPPVTTTSNEPRATGVAATVGEITAPDGSYQVTVDGWPLYRFSGDRAPGMTNGQGIGGQFWLVAPDGTRVRSLRRSVVVGP